jgi:hypothetical protein
MQADRPPLYYACKTGNVAVAASIIAKGGDVDMIDKVSVNIL